jgi:hypothetical protein
VVPASLRTATALAARAFAEGRIVAGVAVVATAALLVACGDDPDDSRPAGPTTTTTPERWPGDHDNDQPVPVDPLAANLTDIKTELKEYATSGTYERDLEAMVARASTCMLDAVAGAERPALVLDIDETALSNYDWMVSVDFLRDSPLLTDLFTEHANTSAIPAIAPTLELYRTAREHDIAVFFITGRAERLRAVTEANLKNVGYTDFAGASFNSPDYKDKSIVPFKSQARADIEQDGYTIIANVGDQDSDLEGGHGGCPHKLPDPYYFIP